MNRSFRQCHCGEISEGSARSAETGDGLEILFFLDPQQGMEDNIEHIRFTLPET